MLNVYVVRATDLKGAQAVISCYQDFVDEAALAVDCLAAKAAYAPV